MNFVERITGVITNPDKTMADIAKEPRIEEALVIVAIYAIVGAISAYMYYLHTPTTYEGTTAADMTSLMSTITAIASIAGGIIGPFIVWLLVVVLLYMFAMVFGGEGKFSSVLTAIGYTTLPKILAAVIGLLLISVAPVAHVVINTNTGSTTGLGELSNSLPMLIASLISLVLLLWSCYMGVFAIKHTEKLSLKSAAMVVGIPLAIYIIAIIVFKIIGMAALGL